jgi:hypothetical protein
VHPVTGFHVSSVHSIRLWEDMSTLASRGWCIVRARDSTVKNYSATGPKPTTMSGRRRFQDSKFTASSLFARDQSWQ